MAQLASGAGSPRTRAGRRGARPTGPSTRPGPHALARQEGGSSRRVRAVISARRQSKPATPFSPSASPGSALSLHRPLCGAVELTTRRTALFGSARRDPLEDRPVVGPRHRTDGRQTSGRRLADVGPTSGQESAHIWPTSATEKNPYRFLPGQKYHARILAEAQPPQT